MVHGLVLAHVVFHERKAVPVTIWEKRKVNLRRTSKHWILKITFRIQGRKGSNEDGRELREQVANQKSKQFLRPKKRWTLVTYYSQVRTNQM